MKLQAHVTDARDLDQIADAFAACGAGERAYVFREYRDAYGYPSAVCGTFSIYLPHNYAGDASTLVELLAHLEQKFDRVIELRLEDQAAARRAA